MVIEKSARTVIHWVGSVQSIAIHTVIFSMSFGAAFLGFFSFDRVLLILTTIVSLEAIYLAIFIQMSLNQTTESLEGVEQDIDEIQEDIDEIQEDVDELQEDVEEMSEEEKAKQHQSATLEEIHRGLQKLMQDIERLQKGS